MAHEHPKQVHEQQSMACKASLRAPVSAVVAAKQKLQKQAHPGRNAPTAEEAGTQGNVTAPYEDCATPKAHRRRTQPDIGRNIRPPRRKKTRRSNKNRENWGPEGPEAPLSQVSCNPLPISTRAQKPSTAPPLKVPSHAFSARPSQESIARQQNQH